MQGESSIKKTNEIFHNEAECFPPTNQRGLACNENVHIERVDELETN
jgi:hypothetical protein